MLHNDVNVYTYPGQKRDNYFSGGKQPVRVLTAEFTQPRLKRPGGGLKPEATSRKCKTGFESSKDKQREMSNQNQFQQSRVTIRVELWMQR